jgi:hypothetical protein
MALKGVSWNNIAFVQYPVVDDPYNSNRVVPDEASAQTLVNAIVHDQSVQITAGTGQGSVAQPGSGTSSDAGSSGSTGSSTTGSSGGSTSSSSKASTGTPTPAPTPVQLSDNTHGQTAATQTCSNGAG